MSSGLEDRFQTLHEIVRAARANLAPGPWDYLVGGTETETTVRRNRQALDSVAFRPRVLRDVSRVDVTGRWFGEPVRLPVMLAPIGSIESFTPGGAATAAKGAARFGVPQMLSSACNPGLEATAQAADTLRIFQLYVRGDDAFVDDWVRRARDHGYRGFCLTVDSAYYSRRERDLARRFVKPWRAAATGLEYQRGLSWDQVKRFKDVHPASRSSSRASPPPRTPTSRAGTASRSSTSRTTAAASSTTAAAASRRCPRSSGPSEGGRAVWVDGGFVRGTDIVKAIALGAQTVGLGRIACMGLAAAGDSGLVRVLELLEEEVRLCLGLLGVTGFDQLDASYLANETPVTPPSAVSAFPLLDLDLDRY